MFEIGYVTIHTSKVIKFVVIFLQIRFKIVSERMHEIRYEAPNFPLIRKLFNLHDKTAYHIAVSITKQANAISVKS